MPVNENDDGDAAAAGFHGACAAHCKKMSKVYGVPEGDKFPEKSASSNRPSEN